MATNNFKIKPILSLVGAILAVFITIVLVGKVLIPFIVALILTYILNPIVEKLHKKLKIKRSVISFIFSILIFIIFLTIPVYIVPTIALQIKTMIVKIPDLMVLFNNHVLNTFNTRYGTHFILDFSSVKVLVLNNVGKVYNHVNLFSPLAKNGSVIIIEAIIYIILIPFIMFYSINEWHRIIKFFDSLIPKSYVNTIHLIVRDIDKMLSAYLRGQISVMLIMATYYGIALQIIGLSSGAIIGIITGLLVFIPYLGVITGFISALCIGFASFNDLHQIIWIIVVFVAGHILEGGLVTPFLVGGKIGLNPVMIILALMVFGTIFGFVGVLLALPLASITVVLLKYAKLYYQKSKYYNEEN